MLDILEMCFRGCFQKEEKKSVVQHGIYRIFARYIFYARMVHSRMGSVCPLTHGIFVSLFEHFLIENRGKLNDDMYTETSSSVMFSILCFLFMFHRFFIHRRSKKNV